MKEAYVLKPHLARFVKVYPRDSAEVPKELFKIKAVKPCMDGINYPLPSKKNDYTCFAEGNNGVMWYAGKTGLTRFDKNAERRDDVIMFFSADRDLADNNVRALLADGDNVWVLTDKGASYIQLKMITMEEKANILLEESVKYVDRHGMISQKGLSRSRDLTSKLPFGECDNDGCFTTGFNIPELLHYAILKKELGIDHPETQRIRKIVMRSVEATLLLMYIPRRGDGFIARTYLTTDEPVPDGLFYKCTDGVARAVETSYAVKRGVTGIDIKADAPIPERLRKLYTDDGYTDNDITYKGDTSSDEVTLHYLNLLFVHDILGEEDPELDEIVKEAGRNNLRHIIEHGYEMHECNGKPTTWAKWSEPYFNTAMGWADACLNAAELLMYHNVVMHITGEKGIWQESKDKLLAMGYGELTMKHLNRYGQMAYLGGFELCEDLMYGDNMLATCAFFGLMLTEKDETLLEKFRTGYKTWRSTIAREHNPGYDFPFMYSCPGEEVDMERIATWFYRTNTSRLAASVSTRIRKDIPQRVCQGGYEEVSTVLAPDECFIAKYDRNPLQLRDVDSGGIHYVESCYVYTWAYWIGRYYGFIK